MLETQIVLGIYAASLPYLGGNLAGPSWMRRSTTPRLPARLRLGVRIGTMVGLAVLAWAGLAKHASAIGRAECAAWLAVLVECLVFLKIAMHRDQGIYDQSHVEGAA